MNLKLVIKSSIVVKAFVFIIFLVAGNILLHVEGILSDKLVHYDTLQIIYYLSLAAHVIAFLVCLSMLLTIYIAKTNWKLMQALIVILLLFLPVISIPRVMSEGHRHMTKQIAREYMIKMSGDSLLQAIKDREDYRLPESDSWIDLAAIHYKPNPNDLKSMRICYNNKLSGLTLNELSPKTVVLFEIDSMSVRDGDKATFNKAANEKNMLLYTADSTVIKYLFDKDEYRLFETNEKLDPVWGLSVNGGAKVSHPAGG